MGGFVPPCRFKDGDIIAFDSEGGAQLFIFKEYIYHNYAQCYMMLDCDGEIDFEAGDYYVERFATEEEKIKLFDAIKNNGYKWNSETKTLENLPKFKVGDTITNGKISITIGYIDNEYYYEISRNIANRLFIKEQDEWNLISEKFPNKPTALCDVINAINEGCKSLMEKTIKVDIPAGYEFAGVDDDKQQVVFEKIGCQYPKTYEECCGVLKIPNDERYIDIDVPLNYNKLLYAFTELLICRDAYCKIAGEQMGLGKPWEPDWSNGLNKCCILNCENRIIRSAIASANIILAFPTEEMRDAFYENFKDLIENCKELL